MKRRNKIIGITLLMLIIVPEALAVSSYFDTFGTKGINPDSSVKY